METGFWRYVGLGLLNSALILGAQPLWAEDSSPFPVSIEHKFGTTVIEEAPERVVSVGYTEQDDLLALGMEPVAVRPWAEPVPGGIWPWAEEAAAGYVPEVLGSGPLDMEAIARLDPDLIIGIYSGITADEYRELSRIAPVVAQPGEYVDYATPWEVQTRMIGRAVGKSDAADELVAGVQTRFAEVAAAHPEFDGKTVAAAFYSDGQPGVFSSGEPRARFFTQLGFQVPAFYDEQAGDAFYAYFSPEIIDVLDVDLLVWFFAHPDGVLDSDQVMRLRRTLDVHNEGREVVLDDDIRFALSFSSPLSLTYALEQLVPELDQRLNPE